MDQCEAFLKKTECPFNWQLSQIDVNHIKPIIDWIEEGLREGVEDNDEPKWYVKLLYVHELFSQDPDKAMKYVETTIQEIAASEKPLDIKCREPLMHIALSMKALMVMKTHPDQLEKVEQIIGLIKPKSAMTNPELAGLLVFKAKMFRSYGPAGTIKGLPMLREAVRLDAEEPEWKLALVNSLNRKRHHFKGTEVQWEQLEEGVDILEELLSDSELTPTQTSKARYLLAVSYYDYTLGKPQTDDIRACKREILWLCDKIFEHSEKPKPQAWSFCAERFSQANQPRKARQIVDMLLEKYPNRVATNVAACKILQRQGDLAKAAEHARIAFENGAYGGAWMWLQCKIQMNEEVDVEEFIQKVLSLFQQMLVKQTHLNASMFYFFVKTDPVKGAYHMEQALNEDPDFEALRKPFYAWYLRNAKVLPIEVAYNQTVLALQANHTGEDLSTLMSARRKIEEAADSKSFCTSRDLVQEALNYSQNRRYNSRDGSRFGGRGRW